MERLCEVCNESGISHVHIETGRLFSAVVKYCQDKGKLPPPNVPLHPVLSALGPNADVLLMVTRKGGLKWIYQLLQSEQPQLIGEGLIALNIVMRTFGGKL